MEIAREHDLGNKLAVIFDTNRHFEKLVALVELRYYRKLSDDSLRLAQYIDPYGNTVFNCLQIQVFIEDCNVLLSAAKAVSASNEEIRLVSDIILLAEAAAKAGAHNYITFSGD